MQDRHQACPCCSALPTPQPHRSGSHQSLDCGRLGQHRSPKCCHCAASPKRRPAHATRPCRPACLTQRILRTSQVYPRSPCSSHTVPQQAVYPRAFTHLSCTRTAKLHSQARRSPTNQINQPTACPRTRSPTEVLHPRCVRARAQSTCSKLNAFAVTCSMGLHTIKPCAVAHIQRCAQPALLFERPPRGEPARQLSQWVSTQRPATRELNVTVLAGHGAGCTQPITHRAMSASAAAVANITRSWWLACATAFPAFIYCTFTQSSGIGQLPHTQRNRGQLTNLRAVVRHKCVSSWAGVTELPCALGPECPSPDGGVGATFATQALMHSSRGYFRDSAEGVWGFSILHRRGVGIFDTPQKVCREMSFFYTR